MLEVEFEYYLTIFVHLLSGSVRFSCQWLYPLWLCCWRFLQMSLFPFPCESFSVFQWNRKQNPQTDRQIDTEKGTDLQHCVQARTDSDSHNRRQRWYKTKERGSKKNESRFLFGKMTLKGSTSLISVLNITLIHYW